MAHLYFKQMTKEIFDHHIYTINNLIDEYGLHNDNTFIALVGAQDSTNVIVTKVQDANEPEKEIYGAKAFQNYFEEKTFSPITILGGPSYLERTLEFNAEKLRIIEMNFNKKRVILADKEIMLNMQNFPSTTDFLSLKRYKSGILQEITPKNINALSTDSCNQNRIEMLCEQVNGELFDRILLNGMIMHNTQHITRTTVNNLTNLFEINNVQINISEAIFNCAIYKSPLFSLIKSNLEWELVKNLEYNCINIFRFSIVQQALACNVITAEQIIKHESILTPWLDNIMSSNIILADFISFLQQNNIRQQGSSTKSPSLNLDLENLHLNDIEQFSPLASPVENKIGCIIS